MEKNEILKVLRIARNLVATRWTKGNYFKDGKVCLVGALSLGVKETGLLGDLGPNAIYAVKVEQNFIPEVFGDEETIAAETGCSCLADFNDASSQIEVLDYLDKRIAVVEG